MIRNNRTDEELMGILRIVHLDYIPNREGGWETRKEWKDVFSGGEKQRVNIKIFWLLVDSKFSKILLISLIRLVWPDFFIINLNLRFLMNVSKVCIVNV